MWIREGSADRIFFAEQLAEMGPKGCFLLSELPCGRSGEGVSATVWVWALLISLKYIFIDF